MAKTGHDLKGRAMPAKKTMPGYVWLLAGLAIGLFIAFLVFLQKQPAEQVSFKEAVVEELKKAKQANDSSASANKNETKPSKEPRFDFYTILPELEVFIPESEISGTFEERKTQPSQLTENSTKKQYLLQAGSFRSSEDADRLKASLALLGVQSSIQSVSINSDTWHRVRIGPFNDTRQLHKTLDTLKNNNIHAMTMELKN
jgi:cell division protein FtsN